MSQLKRGRWSTPELVKLRRMFPRTPIERLARSLNRSVDSVRVQARRLFERPALEVGPWSESSDETLRRGYGAVSVEDLAIVIGRPVRDVRARAVALRECPRTGPWTTDETALLKDLYPSRRNRDLEVCLSRRSEEIERRALELCLRKDKARPRRSAQVRMPRWSDGEIAQLRTLYPTMQNLDIARVIGRSVTSVANKAHQLGLKKCSETRQRIGAANAMIRQRPNEAMPADSILPPR